MLKLLVYLSLIVLFSACGVATSSSSSSETSSTPPVVTDPVEEPKNDNNDYRVDVVDPNPIVDPIDDNVSDNDGTDDPGTDPTPNEDQNDSIFDTSGAIKDQVACSFGDINNGYTNNVLKDNSDDYLGAFDLEDGLGIISRFPYTNDSAKSEVALFYYDLKPIRTNNVITVSGDKHTLSIDTAWAENDEKVIYVRTPKNSDELFGCFRYDLSSINVNGDVAITKVYRLNEI